MTHEKVPFECIVLNNCFLEEKNREQYVLANTGCCKADP